MLAPGARITFNIMPTDTAEAVQRWIKPRRGPIPQIARPSINEQQQSLKGFPPCKVKREHVKLWGLFRVR